MTNTLDRIKRARELLESARCTIRRKRLSGRAMLVIYEYVPGSPTGVEARMNLEDDEQARGLAGYAITTGNVL